MSALARFRRSLGGGARRRLLCGASWIFLALPVGSATAAQVLVTQLSNGDLVGGAVQISLALSADGSEGPGDVSIVVEWGLERSAFFPYALGALRLEAIPSVLTPAASASMSDDCVAVGAIAGRCDLDFAFAVPVPQGVTALASLDFTYLWIPEPGYELCVTSEPDCIEAVQQVQVRILSTALGGPAGTSFVTVGTFGLPGVRPIPEPTTAMLVGLGLALLPQPRALSRSWRGRVRNGSGDEA